MPHYLLKYPWKGEFMKKYLLKRILFSIFSLVVVTGTVMLLVYTLLNRELLFMGDDNYTTKLKESDKQNYAYSQYYEYGYVDYVTFPSWLQQQIDPSSQEYVDAVKTVQEQKVPDEYPRTEYAITFANTYKAKGYEVKWLKARSNSRGLICSGYFIAVKDRNVFERLGTYFGNFFSFDTMWSVKDPNLADSDRYVRWEWDPYSNMPALVGNGTFHRYLIYFDNQFPFVHQNIISLNMGKSKQSEGQDTSELLTMRTGDAVMEQTILPKDLYTENPTLEESNLDFHTVTYSANVSSYYYDIYGEGNHYVNATLKKNGFTRMGNSFVIGIIATIGAYILGLPIGLWMARKKDKLPDKIGNLYIIFIMAVPSLAYIYMFAAIGMSAFNLPIKWALATIPATAFILPIVSLMLPSAGGLMRWIRRYIIDQENADYVKFARSQGLTEREIFSKHIFRNAMIFIVHSIPADILFALVGAIVTERVYGVPGVGGLLTDAIDTHDNGVIIAATVFYTTLSIVALLLGDLLLAKYDPRVSFTNERG